MEKKVFTFWWLFRSDSDENFFPQGVAGLFSRWCWQACINNPVLNSPWLSLTCSDRALSVKKALGQATHSNLGSRSCSSRCLFKLYTVENLEPQSVRKRECFFFSERFAILERIVAFFFFYYLGELTFYGAHEVFYFFMTFQMPL